MEESPESRNIGGNKSEEEVIEKLWESVKDQRTQKEIEDLLYIYWKDNYLGRIWAFWREEYSREEKMEERESGRSEAILLIIGIFNMRKHSLQDPWIFTARANEDPEEPPRIDSHSITLFLAQFSDIQISDLPLTIKYIPIQFLIKLVETSYISNIRNFLGQICGPPIALKLSKLVCKQMMISENTTIIDWKNMIRSGEIEEIYAGKYANYVVDMLFQYLDSLADVNEYIHEKGAIEIEEGEKPPTPNALDEQEFANNLLYINTLLEFLIDLLAQNSTRLYVRWAIKDQLIILFSKLSTLYTEGGDFRTLIGLLEDYTNLELQEVEEDEDDKENTQDIYTTSSSDLQFDNFIFYQPKTKMDKTSLMYANLDKFYKCLYRGWKEDLGKGSTQNIGNMGSRKNVCELLEGLSIQELLKLCKEAEIHVPPIAQEVMKINNTMSVKDILLEIIIDSLEFKKSHLDQLIDLPLMPTEIDLFGDCKGDSCSCPDTNIVSNKSSNISNISSTPISLKKMNLEFTCSQDYFYQNFRLMQDESNYEIGNDIRNTIERMHPFLEFDPLNKQFLSNKVRYKGWARMSLQFNKFTLGQATSRNIGRKWQPNIRADIEYTLDEVPVNLKQEWDSIREHDTLFLVEIKVFPPENMNKKLLSQLTSESAIGLNFPYKIIYIRAVQAYKLYDDHGNEPQFFNKLDIAHGKPGNTKMVGSKRILHVELEGAQYQKDLTSGILPEFSLLIRRRPKENNSKAILETVQSLALTPSPLPEWILGPFLGSKLFPNTNELCGDSDRMRDSDTEKIDLYDTFVSESHFEAVLDEIEVNSDMKELYGASGLGQNYVPGLKRNKIEFAPKQVEGIVSALGKGLTLISGPPGTGKTDVAVQIANLLLKNYGKERILLLAHSNQGLNDIFEKIMELDIEERYLVRLGMGEQLRKHHSHVEDIKDFSREGRVNYMLNLRLIRLEEVKQLADSLKVLNFTEYTCDRAKNLFQFNILPSYIQFMNKIQEYRDNMNNVENNINTLDNPPKFNFNREFPFTEFFVSRFPHMLVESNEASSEKPVLFPIGRFEENVSMGKSLWEYLEGIFKEIGECEALEMLRSKKERGNYLVRGMARVVAMTTTYAAVNYQNLVAMGFEFSSVLMEEAGQIRDVETIIPLTLPIPTSLKTLKRVILIGDEKQLPPVITNPLLMHHVGLHVSLFARLIKLGAKTVNLNFQGRTRYFYIYSI